VIVAKTHAGDGCGFEFRAADADSACGAVAGWAVAVYHDGDSVGNLPGR
jgi:hypothetical protein